MSQYNHEYRQLVIKILLDGKEQSGRNGKTKIIPNWSFTIDNMKTDHKLLLRKMHYKGIEGEFKTLIDPKPLTNVKQFEENGCNYWSNWAGPNGELRLDYHDEMVRQLPALIEGIKNDPNGRRHIINLWNHDNVQRGVLSLPCCWHNLTFSVIDDTLHLTWVQRSVDTMVGLPSDVYLAYLFMEHVAKETSLDMGSCMFSLSNVHIYDAHTDGAYTLVGRKVPNNEPIKFKLIA